MSNLVIIGGGIIGICLARQAALCKFFKKITLIEKDATLGSHASSRNSGVIHAGFYYAPNSKKALFCSEANKLLRDYCINNKVKLRKTGKVVVCKNETEVSILEELYERGKINNSKIFLLDESELNLYEREALTFSKFIWSPNTWSADPKELLKVITSELKELGVEILLNTRVIGNQGQTLIDNKNKSYNYDYLINAAGAYSLNLAKDMGIDNNYVLLPFRGMYLKSNKVLDNFRSHIYPVPNIKQPFLGIHTTVTHDGFIKLGPTAFPAFSPENYKLLEGLDFNFLPEILINQIKLFLGNSFGYRDLAFQELNNLFKRNIISSAQKLTKFKFRENQFNWYTPGIRAQLFNKKTGKLEMDFVNVFKNNQYHILNSISPAWTCSLKTAEYIINEIIFSCK